MKKLSLICTFALAMFLCACTKGDEGLADNSSSEITKGDNDKTEDTTLPEDGPAAPVVISDGRFNWKTLEQVNLSLEAAGNTAVNVYWNEAKPDQSILLEDYSLTADEPSQTPVTVPVGTEKLYMSYATASGRAVTEIPIVDNMATGKLPNDVRYSYEQDASFQFYHNSGVIMVEDRWPNYLGSDADYNDLVMEYDLKTVECTDPKLLPSQGWKEGLVITLDIRGVGSARTKKAGLQLLNFDPALIQRVDTEVWEKSGQGKYKVLTDGRFTIEVDRTQPDRVLILFDGLDKLVSGKHYQTTQGEITTGQPMIRAYIKLSGVEDRSKLTGEQSRTQAIAFRAATSAADTHDFFMVLKPAYHSAEIHQKGYAPTYRYTTYAADSQDNPMSDVYYATADNNVWVLRLPVGTRHIFDRINIFSAYPDFESWVQSNGEQHPTWYRNFVEDYVAAEW